MIYEDQLWYGFLVAWVVVWLWNRFRSGTLKLRYFKFWGKDVSPQQRRDNQVGFGVTAILIMINVIVAMK